MDPQWLCDQLAKVVTIKEINSFASRGLCIFRNIIIVLQGSRINQRDEHTFISLSLRLIPLLVMISDDVLLFLVKGYVDGKI